LSAVILLHLGSKFTNADEMKNIDRWNAAYTAMDDQCREDLLAFAEASACAHPSRKPSLLYLASSCGGLHPSLKPLSKAHDIPAPALVKGVIKIK